MYKVLNISDGHRQYPFLYKDTILYWPDYNPLRFGKNPVYELSFSDWAFGFQTQPIKYIIKSEDCLAIENGGPFRYNGHNYSQCSHIKPKTLLGSYISLSVINPDTLEEDPGYISVQSSNQNVFKNSQLIINIKNPLETLDNRLVTIININDLTTQLARDYSVEKELINISAEIALLNDSDIYWFSDAYKVDNETDNIYFEFDSSFQFNYNYEYIDNLSFVVVCKIQIQAVSNNEEDEIINIEVKSIPLILTPQLYSYILAFKAGHKIEKLEKEDMKIYRPQIIEKVIQNIIEVKSDSAEGRANIIQPVFYRVRELANIIVHPDVTENIAINLDSYKSQVSFFNIKIESMVFPEIGRTDAGIIFKVTGNMLPGKQYEGTYYILNQDAELVTTGKYKYEL